MDVFNVYGTQQQHPRKPSRTPRRGTGTHTPCQADRFKPLINPITKEIKDAWEPCGKHAILGDVLCSIHRRILNETCAHNGAYTYKTDIRVPLEAINMGGCAFSPVFIGGITEAGKTKMEDGKKFFTDAKIEKFNVSDAEHLTYAIIMFFGKPA